MKVCGTLHSLSNRRSFLLLVGMNIIQDSSLQESTKLAFLWEQLGIMSIFWMPLLQQALSQMPRGCLSCFQILMWKNWYCCLLHLSNKSVFRACVQNMGAEVLSLMQQGVKSLSLIRNGLIIGINSSVEWWVFLSLLLRASMCERFEQPWVLVLRFN